ncbi:MAG: hypothetical protein HYR85_12665 [Planctomycetes bacterium]|nr:hypothetical protein [Planctomycetota bacterium]MBI3844313.1 hypothetical protein [Planctomycetota bacterium]
MLVACPGCRQPLEASEKHVGSVVRCGACGLEFEIAPPTAREAAEARRQSRRHTLHWLGFLVVVGMLAATVVLARRRFLTPPSPTPPADETAALPPPAENPTLPEIFGPPIPPEVEVVPAKSEPKREFILDPAWADLDFDGVFDEFWKKWGSRRLTNDEYATATREAEAIGTEARAQKKVIAADPFLDRATKRGENLRFHPALGGRPATIRTEFRPWVLAVDASNAAPSDDAVSELGRGLERLARAVNTKFAEPLKLPRLHSVDDPLGVIVLCSHPPYPPTAGAFHDERRASFDPGAGVLVAAVGPEAPASFALHAAAHQLAGVYGLDSRCLPIREGLADYLAGLAVETPEPLASLRETWKANLTAPPWIPLPRLLKVHDASEIASLAREIDAAHAARITALYHAQTWALVRYLVEGASGRYRAGFVSSLREPTDAELPAAIGIKDPVIFDVQLKTETLALARKH